MIETLISVEVECPCQFQEKRKHLKGSCFDYSQLRVTDCPLCGKLSKITRVRLKNCYFLFTDGKTIHSETVYDFKILPSQFHNSKNLKLVVIPLLY